MVHTPHGGWWDSHLVQGRLEAFWRLRPQSLGKATGPGTQDCGEQLAAREENNDYLVLTGTGGTETGTSDGRTWPPQRAPEAAGQQGEQKP